MIEKNKYIINLTKQKNISAISYHFGGIDGIVKSLLEIRMSSVDADREKKYNQIIGNDNINNDVLSNESDNNNNDNNDIGMSLLGWFEKLERLRIVIDESQYEHSMLSQGEMERMAVLEHIAGMGTEDEQLLHSLIMRHDQVQSEINKLLISDCT